MTIYDTGTSDRIPTDRFVEVRKLPVIVKARRTAAACRIETLEGVMAADRGDIIIEGINGEQYPCKPDIFNKTYEIVERDEK